MKILAALCLLVVGASAQLGPSGLINPDGNNVQFTPDYASSIVLIGPSGAVTKTGQNLQLTAEQAALHAAAPPPPMPVHHMVTMKGAFGHSGIVYPDGNNVQFTPAQADNIVLIGPSGAVTKDGGNFQFTDEGVPSRSKRDAVVGSSGIITPGGKLIQLPPGVAVVLAGHSGAVLSNGDNVQYRKKRHLVGPSGILFKDGQKRHLPRGVYIVLESNTGIVFSDGKNIQFGA